VTSKWQARFIPRVLLGGFTTRSRRHFEHLLQPSVVYLDLTESGVEVEQTDTGVSAPQGAILDSRG
jgi:hypothetical protein